MYNVSYVLGKQTDKEKKQVYHTHFITVYFIIPQNYTFKYVRICSFGLACQRYQSHVNELDEG